LRLIREQLGIGFSDSTSIRPSEEKISRSTHSSRLRSEPSSDIVAPGASRAKNASRSPALTAATNARTTGSASYSTSIIGRVTEQDYAGMATTHAYDR